MKATGTETTLQVATGKAILTQITILVQMVQEGAGLSYSRRSRVTPALALIRGVCIGITNYQVQYYLHTFHMRHKYPCIYVFVCNRMNTICRQPNAAYTLHLANEMRR